MARTTLLLIALCLAACGGGRALSPALDATPAPVPDEAVGLPSCDLGPPRWQCETRPDGRTLCRKVWPDDGLPPSGSGWTCHLATPPPTVPEKGPPASIPHGNTWFCHGTASGDPSGADWRCRLFGAGTWRCEKADNLGGDRPPDTGPWACVKGTIYGGSLCEKIEDLSDWFIAPCYAGQRMWCNGLVTSGWGQVECDLQTGHWKTVTVTGKTLLDCREDLAAGKRPNTLCACYHFFFNPECCEREDCVVPDETVGQSCPASEGKLCDHCNPFEPECGEPGAECIVTNAHETFCGRECASAPCPAGYVCSQVKLKVGTTEQCVPSDLSCYY